MKSFLSIGRLLLVALSFGLMSLAFDPVNFWPAALVALVPFLWVVLREDRWMTALSLGFVWGAAFFAFNLRWLWNLFQGFSVVLWGVLACYSAVFALAMWILNRRWGTVGALAASPVLWVGLEVFRSEGHYLKFAWLSPGFSQAPNLPLAQFASVLGVYGVSFLVVAVNAAFLALLWNWKQMTVRRAAFGMLAVAVLLQAGGWLHLRRTKAEADIPTALVQVETGNFALTMGFSRRAPAGTRLVVWPEYGTVEVLEDPRRRELEEFSREKGAVVVAGCKSPVPGSRFGLHNSAAVVDPERGLLGYYHKANPVQFFNDGVPGTEFPVFDTVAGRIGVAICYDMDFPAVFRSLTRNGAEIIAVPTWDAEWWSKLQHLQHSAMAPMRAIEVRRWVVRAASSGTSQVIDPSGRIHAALPPFQQGLLTGAAGLSRDRSLYMAGGWVFGPLCSVLAACLVLVSVIGRRGHGERGRMATEA